MLKLDKDKCLLCGGCATVCPKEDAIVVYDSHVEIDQDNCIACGSCVELCPMGALELAE